MLPPANAKVWIGGSSHRPLVLRQYPPRDGKSPPSVKCGSDHQSPGCSREIRLYARGNLAQLRLRRVILKRANVNMSLDGIRLLIDKLLSVFPHRAAVLGGRGRIDHQFFPISLADQQEGMLEANIAKIARKHHNVIRWLRGINHEKSAGKCADDGGRDY